MVKEEDRIELTLRHILLCLVKKDYESIETISGGIRLTGETIKQAISDYGRTLVMPPESAFKAIDVIEVIDSRPKRWSIQFDLWNLEEGRSDLTLECTFIENSSNFFGVEIDNIHVL